MSKLSIIHVIDSHTEGEPTRVIIDGGPDLGSGPIPERKERFSNSFDEIRRATCLEPRGTDALVGAIVVAPHDPKNDFGVIFFNNVGYLNMCVHGTIGLVVTLSHLGRIVPGPCRIETPVGLVTGTLHEDGSVSVENVPSYRYRAKVPVQVDGLGVVHGDIAWGGNWFFLVNDHRQELLFSNIEALTNLACRIRQSLEREQITGEDGGEIDHIELFGPPSSDQWDSKNFVLCPGKEYDRSPCGTGTSAKLACLAADETLKAGEVWRQESIIGSGFSGSFRPVESGQIIPTIKGNAFITSESKLVFNPDDPFRNGITI